MNHPLAWTAPQPFWRPGVVAPAAHGAMAQPQILRFATDEFIEEMLATLEQNPGALAGYAAAPETWRGPLAGPVADPRSWTERRPARLLPLLRKVNAKGAVAAPAQGAAPLKLYQPAHQRHYLVAGSLVCQAAGLPDRAIDPARHRVSFVVRRLLPNASAPAGPTLPDIAQRSQWDEYAWVLAGKSGEWRRLDSADSEARLALLAPAEERLAMFPARFTQLDGHGRRLFLGSVPVGRRETYQGGQAVGGGADAGGLDSRTVVFHTQVLGPWKALVQTVMGLGQPGTDPGDLAALRSARPDRIFPQNAAKDGVDRSRPPLPAALRSDRSRLQTASWFLLLDLMLFLKQQLPDFWTDHLLPGLRPTSAQTLLQALYDALDQAAMPAGLGGTGWTLATATLSSSQPDPYTLADQCPGYAGNIETSLLAALRRADAARIDGQDLETALDAAGTPLDLPATGMAAQWPGFLYLFADPWFGVVQPPAPAGFVPMTTDYLSERIVAVIDTLAGRVAAVFKTMPAAGPSLPEPTIASMRPADMREAWYVMRLAYERPDCQPFEATLVSRATVPFQMAGFFDPDAPARPIRIGLPLDISPAGLRKFDKNAVFMMSDMLCGHIDRFRGITLGDLVLSVLPWPFHKDLSLPPDKGPCKQGADPLGVMCTLSIPIITICALILLIIIVSLLDFIFRWLPLFIVCFPLPGFKGRKDS